MSTRPYSPTLRVTSAQHIGMYRTQRRVDAYCPQSKGSSDCRIANNSGIFSKFQKSSRENAQGVEIFHTEPLFTTLLKNPDAPPSLVPTSPPH
jgi:hypothetical protein